MKTNKSETKGASSAKWRDGRKMNSKGKAEKAHGHKMLHRIFFIGFFINYVGDLVVFIVNRVFTIGASNV